MPLTYLLDPGGTGEIGSVGGLIAAAWLRSRGIACRPVRWDRGQSDLFGDGPLFARDHRDLQRPVAWLASLYHPRQFIALAASLTRAGLAPLAADRADSDPFVIFGGSAMVAPEPVALYADAIAIGDIEATGPALVEALALPKRQALDILGASPGWYVPPAGVYPVRVARVADLGAPVPVSRSGGVVTVEASRGCPGKCAYCALGWQTTYREFGGTAIVEALPRGVKSVVLLSAASRRHRDRSFLDQALASRGVADRGQNDRALDLLDGDEDTRALRAVGVEGYSERLRRLVGKPISGDELTRLVAATASDVRLKFYMIQGLPGESNADAAEFLAWLATVPTSHKWLNLCTTPFHPLPHTPLQRCAAGWSEAARARWQRVLDFAHGDTRFYTRAGSGRETADLETAIVRTGRTAVWGALKPSYVASGKWRKVMADAGFDVADLLSAWPDDRPLPWSHVTTGQEAAAERVWRVYQRRMSPDSIRSSP